MRIDDDGAHIYWADPVEGCWVAFRRVDCVGEEELPERRLPAPDAREEPGRVEWGVAYRQNDGKLFVDEAVEAAMKVAAEVIAEKDSRIAALEERVQDRSGW